MPTFKKINEFFFGNPQKLGVNVIPPNKIIEIMSTETKNENDFPYAEDIKNILFSKK